MTKTPEELAAIRERDRDTEREAYCDEWWETTKAIQHGIDAHRDRHFLLTALDEQAKEVARLKEENAAGFKQLQEADEIAERAINHGNEQAREIERLRGALAAIKKHGGKVCDSYESCSHKSCASSYNTWATADQALRKEQQK